MPLEPYPFQQRVIDKHTKVRNSIIGDDIPVERFLSYLEEKDCGFTTPCWIWTRAVGGNGGYGIFSWAVSGQHFTRAAHVLAYQILVGSIPEGLELDHLCKVRTCCRHLEAVTRKVNMERTRKGFCKNDHELTEANIYRHPRTDAIHGCKECRREAVRRRNRKLRGEVM